LPNNLNKISQFWQELKRRKVVRVITVYAAAAFVILEFLSIIIEPLRLPVWSLQFAIIFLCIGFIIAIILSWIYDIHPEEGIVKTEPVHELKETIHGRPSQLIAWKIATYVSAVVIVGLILFHILGTEKRIDLSGLERTIAILPFEDLRLDNQKTALQNALPIALISELQYVKGFTIRHWGSSRKYTETEMKSSDIGEEMNVNFLLKGYILQQGASIDVDIMLIKAVSDEIIWNHHYNRELEDMLMVRRDIAREVASALKNSFEPAKQPLTDHPEAERAFFTGLNYYWKDDSETDFRRSILYFEEAVELDPNFVQAWLKLSSTHSSMYHHQFDRTEDRLKKARVALEKARAIDPQNPDLLLAEGIYFYVIHDYQKALEIYLQAEGQVMDAPELNMFIGALYRRQQNMDKALEYFIKADELSPQNKIFNLELAETYLLLRKYEKAEEYFKRYVLLGGTHEPNWIDDVYLHLLWENGNERSRHALKEMRALASRPNGVLMLHQTRIELIDGNYETAIDALTLEPYNSVDDVFIFRPKELLYAEIYDAMNKIELADQYYDAARILLQEKITDSPSDSRCYSSLGIALAGLGRKEEAIKQGKVAVDIMPITKDFYRGIFLLEDLARIYTMVGEYGFAIDILDQLLTMPGVISVNLLRKDPTWQNLWERDEFNKMLDKHS
jgi:serine/threonine-protein kinase